MNDTKADTRTRQEELGQFLTARPVADFMASMFGPLPSVPPSTERIRWAKLIEAIIEVFRPRWYPSAAVRFGWSRNVLLSQIKAGAYERAVTEKKTHNFDLALPEHFAEQADEMLKSSYNLEFLGLRRARLERPGGPTEISRGWSAAEPPDRPTNTFKPRQGSQKFPMQSRFARFCRPCLGSHGLLDGFRGFRSFLAPPPANFFGPSRGRSHVRTKANPIGVAAYALQSNLPGELKGKLPTAKQLADIVRAEMEGGK